MQNFGRQGNKKRRTSFITCSPSVRVFSCTGVQNRTQRGKCVFSSSNMRLEIPALDSKNPRLYRGFCGTYLFYVPVMARPEGFEPPAFRIGICCDIQLRYGRMCGYYSTEESRKQERRMRGAKIFFRRSTKLEKALAKKRSLAYNI